MRRKVTLPSTALGLRSWLKGTEQGRALLGVLTKEAIEEALEAKCRACENIRPYPKVLLVLRRLMGCPQGGYPGVRIYAEKGVGVIVRELPNVCAETADMERLLEDYLELLLPRGCRHLLELPARQINDAVFRGVSLEECLRHTERAVALGEIRELSKHERR